MTNEEYAFYEESLRKLLATVRSELNLSESAPLCIKASNYTPSEKVVIDVELMPSNPGGQQYFLILDPNDPDNPLLGKASIVNIEEFM